MKEVHRKGIDYHISEPGLLNQNPFEGFIREVRRIWYRTTVSKRVTRQLWDYGVIWVVVVVVVVLTTGLCGVSKT